ncbi:MAG TPA: hypothetical protein DCF33_11065 [Saprospirales bacterium]|nr:hypothetical protein [Saprospirales bacterium]
MKKSDPKLNGSKSGVYSGETTFLHYKMESMKTLFVPLIFGLFALPATLWGSAGDFENRIKAAEMAGNREDVAAV